MKKIPHYHWDHFLKMLFMHKRELVKGHLFALMTAIASVPVPLLMPLLVDEVLLHDEGIYIAFMRSWFPESYLGPVLYIGVILLCTLLLRLISLVFGVLQTRTFTLIAKEVTFQLRKRLLLQLQRISMSEYESVGSGTVTSHFVTDINAIDSFIAASISKTVIAVLSLLGVSIVLLFMHWQLALVILLLNPLVIYFTVKQGRRVKNLKKLENAAVEEFQQELTETLDAVQQIRSSNRESYFINKVITHAEQIKQHSAKFTWRNDAANRLSFNIFLFGFEVFRAVSMLMVLFSDLTIGQMMAVFGYLWYMMTPVQDVLNIQYAYFSANAALGRINQMMKLREEPQYTTLRDPFVDNQTVSISLKHVNFNYPNNNSDKQRPTINDLSLEIIKGKKVALVGPSGGGKSTLVQLILGLYAPDSGQILFDDVPMHEIGLNLVRENVTAVLQHPAMMSDSIRNNLTLGRECHEDQVWSALSIAQLDDFVKKLPQQLDTLIGTQGVRLSGGQRQRLAIARMVLSDPAVVILDESTSALDTRTEAKLHDALQQFLQGRTTVIIAHRLSAVRHADEIYVIEDGNVIENGNHQQLMAHEGIYYRLYA